MKTSKILSIIILFISITLAVNNLYSKEMPNPDALRTQIYKELISLFEKPIPLAYEDKNLKGEVNVTIVVADNGKLFVSDVIGENNILNKYVSSLISSRNLWTNPDLAGTKYLFKIISK